MLFKSPGRQPRAFFFNLLYQKMWKSVKCFPHFFRKKSGENYMHHKGYSVLRKSISGKLHGKINIFKITIKIILFKKSATMERKMLCLGFLRQTLLVKNPRQLKKKYVLQKRKKPLEQNTTRANASLCASRKSCTNEF